MGPAAVRFRASFAFLEQLEDGGHGAEARPLLPSLHPRPPVDLLVRHRGGDARAHPAARRTPPACPAR